MDWIIVLKVWGATQKGGVAVKIGLGMNTTEQVITLKLPTREAFKLVKVQQESRVQWKGEGH